MALFVLFDYLNHRDENTLKRRVRPTGFFHGKSEWFQDLHSFMVGTDFPRGVVRTFAIDRMSNIRLVEEDGLCPDEMTVPELVCKDVLRVAMIGTERMKAELSAMRTFGVSMTEAYILALDLAVHLRRELELRKSEGV